MSARDFRVSVRYETHTVALGFARGFKIEGMPRFDVGGQIQLNRRGTGVLNGFITGFEDFWAAWRARGLDPRTINMVTGPSRSADIGQVLQLGAHGPVALHVFLVGETGAG